MTVQTLLRGTVALFAAACIHAAVAQDDTAEDVVETYVSKAVATVKTIYDSGVDELERSSLIGQSGVNEYWVSGRQTTIAGKGSGAAFAELLGFRPDSWEATDFRQAGDFGEIAVEFSRTKTFRSGEKSTSTKTLVYEMVKVGDSWSIASFRAVVKEDQEAEVWDAESATVNVDTHGASPQAVVQAQLDLLRGLPPQALRSASEKSAPLWQDTRDARQGQGRVIATVSAVSSISPDPVEWELTVVEEGAKSATVRARVVSEKPMAFNGLLFSLEKNNNQWLLSAAVATR